MTEAEYNQKAVSALLGNVQLLTDSRFGEQAQVVELEGRPPIAFDVLSVDIGITPSKAVPGSSSVATPVKPISGYESFMQSSSCMLMKPVYVCRTCGCRLALYYYTFLYYYSCFKKAL